MPHVLAQATYDVGKFDVEADFTPYIVKVTGSLYGGDKLPDRTYQIGAVSEDIACRAGLDLYVNEMEKLN